MRVDLPDEVLPAKLTLNPEQRMSDDEYYDFCVANPDVRFERSSAGEILIVPPAGYESDQRNVDVIAQLKTWARRDGRGRVSGSSTEFILPSGAAYSPDAAWVSNARLASVNRVYLRKFPRLVPEFVVEVMSPTDRLKAAKSKMNDWIAEGVELAWLIDGDNQTVWIYRAGHDPEKRTGIGSLAGEGPVTGFVLQLEEIWAAL